MVSLSQIRDELLPGLMEIRGSYSGFPRMWEKLFELEMEPAVSARHIWVPKLTIPQAVVVGAVVAVVKNPIVTRRFWAGWFSPNTSEVKTCH